MTGGAYGPRTFRSLPYATEGCCTGHRCDNCSRCRVGRCCRRDNPTYQLPAEGDWDGPIYGEIGQRNVVGDTVECHICGAYYRALGFHIWMKHNVTADEYKALFGLSKKGLVTPDVHDALAKKSAQEIERLKRQRYQSTPEQLSAQRLGTRLSRETRVKLSSGGRVMRPCTICGAMVERWRNRADLRIVCSDACQAELARQINSHPKGGSVSAICPICGRAFMTWRSRVVRQGVTTCGDPTCTRELLSRLSFEREQHTRRGRRRQG